MVTAKQVSALHFAREVQVSSFPKVSHGADTQSRVYSKVDDVAQDSVVYSLRLDYPPNARQTYKYVTPTELFPLAWDVWSRFTFCALCRHSPRGITGTLSNKSTVNRQCHGILGVVGRSALSDDVYKVVRGNR
jgi:hypothetical protein